MADNQGQTNPPFEGALSDEFYVRGVYAYQRKQPVVVLTFQGRDLVLRAKDARALALFLLEAAEAATADAVLWSFWQVELGMSEAEAARAVAQLAAIRDRVEGIKPQANKGK